MKTITSEQKLQLIGLLTLAREHNQKLTDITRAVAEIVDETAGDYASDAVYGSEIGANVNLEVDVFLDRVGVRVDHNLDQALRFARFADPAVAIVYDDSKRD